MQIAIHNPDKLKTIDYRSVQPFQGELKDLSRANYDKLKSVLDNRGFITPLFIWFDGDVAYLMDGHQRQRVMAKEDMNDKGSYNLPYVSIPAKDAKEAKAKLLEITSQYGTITQEGFDQFIADAELPEAEVLEAVAFDALPFLKEKIDVVEDDAPDLDETESFSELGKIYQVGRHRVLCGSFESDLTALFDGKTANATFTDPPYNIDYQGGAGKRDRKKIVNDKMSDDEFASFLDTICVTIKRYTSGGVLVFVSCNMLHLLRKSFENAGLHWQSYIIWVKNRFTLSRTDFQSRYEPISYGVSEGATPKDVDGIVENTDDVAVYGWNKHDWNGGRKQSNVWFFNSPNKSAEHPTMKPIALCAKGILSMTRDAGVVFDPFLGSGSTLIACEQTSRSCIGCELEPGYVDVIRKRYWKFTHNDNEDGWQDGTPEI